MVALPKQHQTISPETIQTLRQNVPPCIQTDRQYLVWKYQVIKGKRKKPPFTPQNGKAASTNDPTTWGTLDQALSRYARGGYDGIGYVCHRNVVGGDIDHCRDLQTGVIAPWAQSIIDRLSPYAYFEISPSGTGIRFIILADLPFNYRKEGPFELSYHSCYITLTGNHLEGTPTNLLKSEQAQNVLDEIVTEYFPERLNVNTGGGDASTPVKPRPISSHTRTIDQIIEKATGAKNGYRFSRLMAGNAQGYKSRSEAHLALCSMLVYWTNGDESQIDQIFRQSGFFDEETAKRWDEVHSADGSTYGEMTIEKALLTSRDYSLPKPSRQTRAIPHIPPAPRITIEEHRQKLASIGRDIQAHIRAHIKSLADCIHIEQVSPGVGKSHAAASIGVPTTQPTADGQFNLAWIAQRHNMVDSVADLQYYRHIQPCTDKNCHEHGIHHYLGLKGYNTMSVHSKHLAGCDYADQFKQEGSAVYQMPHIKSSYPAKHEGIILDELDPAAWLQEREVTVERLHTALLQYSPESTADKFLRILQGLLTDTAQRSTPLYGKALFDALNQASGDKLIDWLARLDQSAQNRDAHPFVEIDPYAEGEEHRVQSLAPVLMPHLLQAFMAELVRWQKGENWNSLIRIGPAIHGGGYALYITQPLQFTPGKDGTLPPTILLDATADQEIHSRLFGRPLKINRVEVDPAPGTRHIAIRSGKRYGKTSLTTKRKDGSANKDLQRSIAECRYMLQRIDPTGEAIRSESVGIISFMGCVDAMGEALDIPEHRRGHYWGIRGSNALEDCSILLLVGTPSLRPDELLRQARALYRDDPELIKETTPEEYKQTKQHTDSRLQHYAEYMTNSELTQAAHRNRPVRYENRTVVSFCLGDIDFLPITETIVELPYLTVEGEDRYDVRRQNEQERLEKAYIELSQNSHKPTQSEIAKVAKVRKQTVVEWMHERDNTPPQCLQNESSGDTTLDNQSSTPGTSESEATENAPTEPQPIPLEVTFWSVGQQRGYPEIPDLDLRSGKMGWNSFSLTHRLRIPDVVARLGGVA